MEKLIYLSQKETVEPGEVVFVALQKAFSKVKSAVNLLFIFSKLA